MKKQIFNAQAILSILTCMTIVIFLLAACDMDMMNMMPDTNGGGSGNMEDTTGPTTSSASVTVSGTSSTDISIVFNEELGPLPQGSNISITNTTTSTAVNLMSGRGITLSGRTITINVATLTGGDYQIVLAADAVQDTAGNGNAEITLIFNVTPSVATATQWTSRTSGTTLDLSGIIHDGRRFVAVGLSRDSTANNNPILQSDDGITWTINNTGPGNNFIFAIAHGNGVYVVQTFTAIYSSTNLTDWTMQRSFNSFETSGTVQYANNLFVAVGRSGTIVTSPDGTTWTDRTTSTTEDLVGIYYSNNVWFAVGFRGGILTSTDAITWTSQTSGVTNLFIDAVTYANNQWIAVGQNGTILTSPDAITWTSQENSGINHSLWDAFSSNGITVISGEGGNILRSNDNTMWTSQTTNTTNGLGDIIYANGLWVVVGIGGTILTSP